VALFESHSADLERDLPTVLHVVGVPDDEAWPCFLDTLFATKWWKEVTNLQQQPIVVREVIPETMLSSQGFEVLSGLLVCNPNNRLTVAASLKLPWFTNKDALEEKAEVLSLLPTEKKSLALF
jgi:cell division cycle 2-like